MQKGLVEGCRPKVTGHLHIAYVVMYRQILDFGQVFLRQALKNAWKSFKKSNCRKTWSVSALRTTWPGLAAIHFQNQIVVETKLTCLRRDAFFSLVLASKDCLRTASLSFLVLFPLSWRSRKVFQCFLNATLLIRSLSHSSWLLSFFSLASASRPVSFNQVSKCFSVGLQLNICTLCQDYFLDLFSATRPNEFAEILSFMLEFWVFCLSFKFCCLSVKNFCVQYKIFGHLVKFFHNVQIRSLH